MYNSHYFTYTLTLNISVMKSKIEQTSRIKKSKKEANARRAIAKKWQSLSHRRAYKRASAKTYCKLTTDTIKEELFEGIILNLNESNNEKSYKTKIKILRRIVEKRQAQSIHRRIGRTESRFASYLTKQSISKSIQDINNHIHCA